MFSFYETIFSSYWLSDYRDMMMPFCIVSLEGKAVGVRLCNLIFNYEKGSKDPATSMDEN